MKNEMLFETGTMIGMSQPAEGASQTPPWSFMVQMVLMIGIVYFIMIRPQMKAKKEQAAMLEAMKTGDDVITTGGILGTVANVKETTVIIKIADNVKIEVVKAHVAQVTKVEKKS
jgi:preprotein translocase subunit YajC